MAVAAAQRALRTAAVSPDVVMFATANPVYLDKSHAAIVHAALHLDAQVPAFDMGVSARSAMGGLVLAAQSTSGVLLTTADTRHGLAGSADESAGADAACAIVIANDHPERPVLAEIIGSASTTAEFIDRWRTPGDLRTKVWDERFTEVQYQPLVTQAWYQALSKYGLTAADVALAAVAAPSARVGQRLAACLSPVAVAEPVEDSIGSCGAAHALVALGALLDRARTLTAGSIVALVSAADGADVVLLRTTVALTQSLPPRSLAEQMADGAPVSYGRYLQWRGLLATEPPRRPEPPRVSAPAAARSTDWKYGFVAAQDRQTGRIHMPPSRVSAGGDRVDDMDSVTMSQVAGTIVTFTVDRLAYSPSPPIMFAVVDFDGGGRLPVELCDVAPDEVAVGMRVEPAFRRLNTADGLANYFWKARPLREAEAPVSANSAEV